MDHKRLIRSFGRIRSRKLSIHKQGLLADLLAEYEITINHYLSQDQKEHKSYQSFIDKFSEIHLEIGFGFGDFLFESAKRNPHIGFIASETHINGIVSLLAKLDKESLDNVRIFQLDVRLLLDQIKQKCFNKIYILFPDPWPKTKHHKRRLINEDFLQIISSKMLNNSQLIIATDHDSYKRWILAVMFKSNISGSIFKWKAKSREDWQNFPNDWIYTKYQNKAQKEGRKSIFLEYELLC